MLNWEQNLATIPKQKICYVDFYCEIESYQLLHFIIASFEFFKVEV